MQTRECEGVVWAWGVFEFPFLILKCSPSGDPKLEQMEFPCKRWKMIQLYGALSSKESALGLAHLFPGTVCSLLAFVPEEQSQQQRANTYVGLTQCQSPF